MSTNEVLLFFTEMGILL